MRDHFDRNIKTGLTHTVSKLHLYLFLIYFYYYYYLQLSFEHRDILGKKKKKVIEICRSKIHINMVTKNY